MLAVGTVCEVTVYNMNGDGLSWIERRTDTQPTQVRFPGAAQGIFLLESTFSADSLTVSVYPPCAIARTYVCVHVKDPVIHVGVR